MWELSLLGSVGSRVAPTSLCGWGYISSLESFGGGSIGTLTYQSISTLSHLGKSPILGSLGFECFQPSLNLSDELSISSSCISPTSSVPVSGRTCNQSVQTSYSVAPCWMEASWLPTVLNMLVDVPHSVSHHSRPCHRCLSWLGAQGSAIPAFKPLAAQRCVLCRQGLSSFVGQAVARLT